MRSALLAVAAVLATVGAALAPIQAQAAPEAKHARTVSAQVLLAKLTVHAPDRKHHYSQKRFPAVDADADGCSTRREVLSREGIGVTRVVRNCALTGRWRSAYDGRVSTDADAVVVDHLVPLAEAWRSGAWRWTAARRTAFANDLGYRASLQVASAASVRAKANRDPARWLPPKNRCAYAKSWIAVKARWNLSVDPAERWALSRALATCKNLQVRTPGRPNVVALTGSRPTHAIVLPANPTVYYFGDSWTHGASAAPGRGFPYVLGEILGWQTELGPDNSGAGFVHTWWSEHPVLPVSAAALGPIDADLIVVEGGINDEPGPLTDFRASTIRTIRTLQAKSKGTPIVMVGPASPDGITPESLAVIDQQEAAAARRLGIHYISPVRERWFTPDTVGQLIDQDTFHPNTAGHAYYAGRLAGDLQRFVTTRVGAGGAS